MKVKDIIDTHMDFSFADTKVNFIVKPNDGGRNYFNSESNFWRNSPEIMEMTVERWMICDARKNKCIFVIFVTPDKEYEEKREKAWKDLLAR